MRHELKGKIIRGFAALRTKTFSYLTDGGDEDKNAKDLKKCVIKQKNKFKDYNNCLEANIIENNINQLYKNKAYMSSWQWNQSFQYKHIHMERAKI